MACIGQGDLADDDGDDDEERCGARAELQLLLGLLLGIRMCAHQDHHHVELRRAMWTAPFELHLCRVTICRRERQQLVQELRRLRAEKKAAERAHREGICTSS